MSQLVHLQTHSVYSLRRSLLGIEALVATAAERGHRSVALTDVDGVYGMVPFVKAARKAGLRPLVGSELTLSVPGLVADKPHRVTLLARDAAGYANLSRLISHFHLTGRTGVSLQDLVAHARGLTLLTGGQHGALPRMQATMGPEAALRLLGEWKEAFGPEHCHVQLGPWWPASGLLELGAKAGLGVVAAQEACYLMPEEEETWKLQQAGHGLGHPAPGPRHLATDQELVRAWKDVPEALRAMEAIAEACTYEPVFGVPRLPEFKGLDGLSNPDYLRRLCEEGLERRYAGHPLHAEATSRMAYELSVIEEMGFVDYFLIAWDIVRFARARAIPYIPRGSAAGSLVLYLLDVTSICPLAHTLCFERFLHVERKALPDIDLDFDWQRRDEVIDYCFTLYGEDHVARIATHQHHGPRGAVRLSGAAHGLEEETVGKLARKMPWSGPVAAAPEIQSLPLHKEPYKSLIATADAFQGLPDHLSLHPCGIVISREPLTEVVPLEASAMGPIVTQFEMHGVEEVGLLKMDLLCNRNLRILADVVALVRERHGVQLAPEELPLDDERAFALIRTGRTLGIYQLESGGVQGLLRQFLPTHVEDVTAITSLYRPGPIDGGITPRYVARRHGKEPVTYPDPCLEGVLKHTYGLILFQEQCLQVTSVYAGMSLGASDNLRRGIAKRIRPEVERIKAPFFEGAHRLGRDPRCTEEVWKLLESFAGYGFVKAHAASCASLAVREAYIKARWPVEYLACVLSTGMGYYPPRVYIEDARHFGAEIALPCVNRSAAVYTVEGERVLRVGLSYLHGIGPAGVRAILDARQDGPFQSLADLKHRTGLARPELETLIRLGACECFGLSRPALLRQLSGIGKSVAPSASQLRLFGDIDRPAPKVPDHGDYPLAMRQSIEREILGFTVTVQPLPQEVGSVSFAEARQLPRRARVSVVAEVVSRFGHRTKKGERMSFLTLSDGVDHCQAVLFPEAYRRLSAASRRGPAMFSGVVEVDRGEFLLVISEIEPLSNRWGVS